MRVLTDVFVNADWAARCSCSGEELFHHWYIGPPVVLGIRGGTQKMPSVLVGSNVVGDNVIY